MGILVMTKGHIDHNVVYTITQLIAAVKKDYTNTHKPCLYEKIA